MKRVYFSKSIYNNIRNNVKKYRNVFTVYL